MHMLAFQHVHQRVGVFDTLSSVLDMLWPGCNAPQLAWTCTRRHSSARMPTFSRPWCIGTRTCDSLMDMLASRREHVRVSYIALHLSNGTMYICFTFAWWYKTGRDVLPNTLKRDTDLRLVDGHAGVPLRKRPSIVHRLTSHQRHQIYVYIYIHI